MSTQDKPQAPHTVPLGWVYLIVNDLIPSRVKIGYTMRDPITRAAELISTGTTGTFVVIYQALVDDPYAVEQQVHKRLALHNTGLEWFQVCPNRAKEMIRTVADTVHHEGITPRWHPSQPEPSRATKELLQEARKAAEDERRRQAEKEALARAAAEEARIRAAREAEKQRFEREAEEAAEHARQKALEEQAAASRFAEQRRLAEKRQRQTERAKRLIFRVFVPITLAGILLYAIGGPYPRDTLQKLRADKASLEQTLRQRITECDAVAAELAGARKRLTLATQASAELSESIVVLEQRQHVSEFGLYLHRRIQAERLLAYAPSGLRNTDVRRIPPDIIIELGQLERDIKQEQAELSKLRGQIKSAKQKRDTLPQEVKDAQEAIARLEAKVGACRSEATRRQEGLRSRLKEVDARLGKVVSRNQLFPWASK